MKQHVRILALTPILETMEQIKEMLEGVENAHLETSSQKLVDAVETSFNSHIPDILFVELELDDPEEFGRLSAVIRENDGHLAVVATAPEASVEHVRSLMRAGVTDFLPQPFSRHDLLSAIETAVLGLVPKVPETAHQGQVIAFMGVAGGVGNTTLAIETAAQLLPGKKKQQSPTVCLLDLDLQGGNVALSLDIPSELGVDDLIEAQERFDIDLAISMFSHHASGLEVLAAPRKVLPFDALTPVFIGDVLNAVRSRYDYAVLDLPAVWTNWTLPLLSECDALVLVSALDVTSMARTRRYLDVLTEYGIEDLSIAMVVNRFPSGWGMRRRRKDAEKGLNRRIDFLVRDDAKTASAARDRGVLLRRVRSRSPIVRDVRAIVTELVKSRRRASALIA